jgi:hypothetical protein
MKTIIFIALINYINEHFENIPKDTFIVIKNPPAGILIIKT